MMMMFFFFFSAEMQSIVLSRDVLVFSALCHESCALVRRKSMFRSGDEDESKEKTRGDDGESMVCLTIALLSR